MISEALMVTSWDLWAHDSGVKQPLKIFFLQERQRRRRGYSPKGYLCKKAALKAGREYRKAYKQIRGSEYVRKEAVADLEDDLEQDLLPSE